MAAIFICSVTSAAASLSFVHWRRVLCREHAVHWQVARTIKSDIPVPGSSHGSHEYKHYKKRWLRAVEYARSKGLVTPEEYSVASDPSLSREEMVNFQFKHEFLLPTPGVKPKDIADRRLERDRGVSCSPCHLVKWSYGPAHGTAIAEYADLLAAKMGKYNEAQATTLYNGFKFANVSIEDQVRYRPGTLDLARALLLEQQFERVLNDETFSLRAGDLDAVRGRLKRHLAQLMFQYNVKRHALIGALFSLLALIGVVVCAVYGIKVGPARRAPAASRSRVTSTLVSSPSHFDHGDELPATYEPEWMWREPSAFEVDRTSSVTPYRGPVVPDRDPPEPAVLALTKPQRPDCHVRVWGEGHGRTSHPLLRETLFWPIYYNRKDPVSFEAAAVGRVFIQSPPICPARKPAMELEADILARRLPRVESLDLLDIENRRRWVASRPYSALRKRQLLDAIDSDPAWSIQSFVKDEPYLEPGKAPRLINAANDARKTIYGPLFDVANAALFALPETTKHIPVRDRPRYIDTYLMADDPGRVVFVTDMSAFECSMTREMMQTVEMRVYKYMLPSIYHPVLDKLLDNVHTVNRTVGVCLDFSPIRLSGEMNTSLGNTITNLVSVYAAMRQLGFRDSVRVVVEGDDAMISVTREGFNPDDYIRVMTEMGYRIKMEAYDVRPGQGGYCSMYWSDSGSYIVDPLKTLMTFYCGSNSGTAEAQLAAKALCLSATCPGVPILSGLASHYLRREGVMPYNAYELEELVREGLSVRLVGRDMVVSGEYDVPWPSEDAFVEMALHLDCPVEFVVWCEQHLRDHGICNELLSVLLDGRTEDFVLSQGY